VAEPGPARPDPVPASDSAPASPWREPVRGGHPDPQWLTLPGIEQLRGLIAGESPQPPLARLTGLRLEAVGDGTAAFRMPLTGWLLDGTGSLAPGPLTIPADGAMACAIMTQLPPGTPFTTSELALRVLRPVRVGGSIHAEGRVIGQQPPIMLADATLRDDEGTLIAHATSMCVSLPAGGPHFAPAAPRADEAASGDPDPWQRQPPPAPDTSQAASGLGLLEAQLDEEMTPPLQYLTGLSVTELAEGEATFSLPTSGWLAAPPPGRVQGGVVATLADAAIAGAIRTTLPPGTSFTPVELKLNYLRPLATDGREARAQARLLHAGRRIAVGRADVVDADGRAIAVASGSGLLGPSQS
jgi:uncharacterized protein (TIGR00369 family)